MRKIGLIGSILKDRYCILEKIGQGGEGSLYLAKDMELGTLWAVKEVPSQKKREAKLLLQLKHPGLPGMVDYAEGEGVCYLVMEYIRGRSLGAYLKEGRTFSPEEVIRTGRAAAEILRYLHSRRPPVYYGDLKPENLMLSGDGNLYLVDLGSAVFGYESFGRGNQGTPGFAAPEQYEGKVGKASDVYNLGKTMQALLGKGGLPCFLKNPRLAWCLGKCCRKSPRLRYRDMESVDRALKKAGEEKGKGRLRAAAAGALLGAAALAGAALSQKTVPLEGALTEVTKGYYDSAFLRGNPEKRREVCTLADELLQKDLMEYRAEEEQKEILFRLAVNGELMGEGERAALYYEQLLLYYPEEAEGYAQYGLFLCRQGQEEASGLLWKKYEEQKAKGVITEESAAELQEWTERLEREGVGSDDGKKKEKGGEPDEEGTGTEKGRNEAGEKAPGQETVYDGGISGGTVRVPQREGHGNGRI